MKIFQDSFKMFMQAVNLNISVADRFWGTFQRPIIILRRLRERVNIFMAL